ncbi:MAG: carboxypeptidase-like regulatory domain-containing protein [Bacteroidales bacterium]
MSTFIMKIMKTQSLFLYFIGILITTNLWAQSPANVGQIFDETEQQPIPGVTISLNGKAYTFSDEGGKYYLPREINMQDTLTFSHLTYKMLTISIKELANQDNQIIMREAPLSLSAVTITYQSPEKILKEAAKQYRKKTPDENYFARSRFQQFNRYKGVPASFIECEGYSYIRGSKHKNPFDASFMVPEKLRRSSELKDYTLLKGADRPCKVGYASGIEVRTLWRTLRFFECSHPFLRKLNSHFQFSADSVVQLNDKACYLFTYQQIKGISLGGNLVKEMKGQIWITKDAHTLVKITSKYRKNREVSTIDISYNTVNGQLYPEDIKIKTIHNYMLRRQKTVQTYHEGRIQLDSILPPKKEIELTDFMFALAMDKCPYEQDQWSPISGTHNYYEELKILAGDRTIEQMFGEAATKHTYPDEKCYQRTMEQFYTFNTRLIRQLEEHYQITFPYN